MNKTPARSRSRRSRAEQAKGSTFRRARLSREDAAGRRGEPHFRPLPKEQQQRGRRSDEGDIRAAGKGRRRGRKDSSFSGQITAPSRKPFAAFPVPPRQVTARDRQAGTAFSLPVFFPSTACRSQITATGAAPKQAQAQSFPSIIRGRNTSLSLAWKGRSGCDI